MPDELLTKLRKATRGLLYPSEYDAPLEPFVWGPADNTAAEVRRLSGQPAKARPKVGPADDFFRPLAEDGAEGFAELHAALKEELADLKAYRFGAGTVTVFVVGRDGAGRLAGFRTTSVET